MVESEPTISPAETSPNGAVATMERADSEALDASQKVTDEQLQGLDPSVLDLMSNANAVLGGEQTIDEAFAEDADSEAEAKADETVVSNTTIPTPATHTLVPAAQTVPPAAPAPSAIASAAPSAPIKPAPAEPGPPSSESSDQDSDEVPVYSFTTVDDTHGREVRAHELAEKRLTAELNEGGKFKRFVKSIWQGNVARDQYIAKYAAQYRSEIDTAGNINLDDENAGFEQEALIKRFSSEYDEMIHTDAGERRAELASDSEFATRTKDLLGRYARGELNDESLVEERGRMLKELADSGNTDLLGEGKLQIDNLVQIARAVKGSFEHGKSLERMLEAMRFTTGEAKSGARTEVRYNAVERVAQRLSSTRLGALMSPEAVITAVGITTTLLHLGSRSATNAALKTIAPGLSGAIWAGVREGRRTKEERAQNARERAYGGTIGETDQRRLEMDRTNYDLATAASLTEELRSLTGENVDLSQREALEAVLASLSAIEARMKLADGHNIDLITYDDQTTVEAQRFDLDLARAEAKVALNQHLTDELRAELGISAEQPTNDLIEQRAQGTTETLTEMISERDKAFNKLRTKRMASAAVKGLIIGGTIGLAAQETMAAFDPSRAGLIEQLWHAKTGLINGEQHQTLLEGFVNGDHSTIHHMAESSFGPDQHIGQNGTLSMSADHHVNYDPTNHTLSFTDPTGHETIGNVPVGSDGSLSQSTQDMLAAKGFNVENLSHQVTDAPEVSTSTQTLSVEDYIHQHPDLTTHIKRDMWFDNNTPGKFDHNELGLHWGGSGVNQDGSFQMSVSSMTENGSFHGGTSVDWSQEAASGHLELAVSATSGTQTEVFMVPIGPDGSIHIAADNPAAHFFANENGHAVFNGKYAEVVQTLKTDDSGVEHVRPLATLVGHGNVNNIQETIQTVTPHSHMEFDYRITSPGYDTVQQNFTEMAPNIPIIPRRPMETLSRRELSYYYRGGEVLSSAEVRRRREETSPRLLDNPDADLVPGQELKWYHDLLVKKRGRRYVKDLEDTIDATPELRSISPDIKAIVQIPVNAAGNSEANGIYNLLTQAYGRQNPEALNQTMILLHVNWFDQYPAGGAQSPEAAQANIEKTIAEIERAKTDNPQLRIAVISTEWKREDVQSGVIGLVARKMYDVSLLALNRAAQTGQRGDNGDVVLIRNDADAKGVSVNYLSSYIGGLTADGEADILTGTTSFDSTKADRMPGLVAAANFMQTLDLLNATRGRHVHTGGANFGVKASTFAAVGGLGVGDDNGAGSDDVNVGRRIKSARDGVVSNKSRRSGERLSYAYTGYSSSTSSSKRRIARRISGRIETDSDREEELYVQGIPIVNTWNSEFGFDRGGYRSRDEGLAEDRVNESLRDDPEAVIEHIRLDMEGSINSMGSSLSAIDTALTLTFAGIDAESYKLTHDSRGFHLEFTPEGKKYLQNYLTRDPRGRFDSYKARKLRRLYGEAKPEAKRQPTHQQLFGI